MSVRSTWLCYPKTVLDVCDDQGVTGVGALVDRDNFFEVMDITSRFQAPTGRHLRCLLSAGRSICS